jgi:hypothetical protein
MMGVSEDLDRALDCVLTGADPVDQLAQQLGPRGELSEATLELLEAMLAPLEVVLEEGPPPDVLETRGRRVADEALRAIFLTDHLIEILGDFGWGRHELRGVEARFVNREIREVLAARLGGRLRNMLARWEKAGHLDLEARERRRTARYDLENAQRVADRRRDRTDGPKLSW